MKHKRLPAALLLLPLIASCGGGGTSLPEGGEYAVSIGHSADIIEDHYRTFYQIFVGSFSDSDGDRTGDLRGIINRLDYLNDGNPDSGKSLGVTGIWLTPIFRSYSYHKYDVVDYYTIDPQFGTEDDLKELIEACHNRGIRIILDLPINHTSSSCQWFLKFCSAVSGSSDADPYYADFYTHCDAENIPASRTFQKISGTDEYYECNFSGDMPELNFDNEAVRETVVDVAAHWLNLGIDGFRFDAAKYIYYGDDASSVSFWDWYIGQLKSIKEDIFCIGEVWSSDSEILPYYSSLNCFNFQMGMGEGKIASTAKKTTSVNKYVEYISSFREAAQAYNPDAVMAPFIANHDTDRAAGFLNVDTYQMQMAASLMMLSSGTPFIYYGEEIGMKGSRGSASTDANRRLAMLWGDEDTVKDPQGATYSKTNQVNGTVADQLGKEDSLYNHYKKLIMIRNAFPEIARGTYTPLSFEGQRYFGGFLATYGSSVVGVFHNTDSEEITVDLPSELSLKEVMVSVGKGEASLQNSSLTLPGCTSVILK